MASFDNKPERPDVRFRCASVKDFTERAAHLAFVIGVSERKSNDLLAKIYGFENYDDLHRDLREAAKSPETHPPGPFEDDTFFRTDRDGMQLDVLRGNYALHSVAAFAKTNLAEMPHHFWEVREMGLFFSPRQHRTLFNKVRAKIEAMEIHRPTLPETDPTPNAYAYPTRTRQGEATLAFTAKGAAISEILVDIADRYSYKNPTRYVGELQRLREKYPKNPWVGARYVMALSNYIQSNKSDEKSDATAIAIAYSATECAKEAIEQFEALLGRNWTRHAPAKLLAFTGPHGCDSYYFPASLYWGGVAAVATGDLDQASKWLGRLVEIDDDDHFDARGKLAEIENNPGFAPRTSGPR